MFYETLLALCNEKGVGPTNLVNMLGISTGNLSKWKAGGIPKGDTLLKIADYFDCSVDHLLGRSISANKQSHKLQSISNSMDQLNEGGDFMFLSRVKQLLSETGVSKSKLLSELELNRNAFVDWEKRGTIPSGDAVARIAGFFNVSTDYLLGLTENRTPSVTISRRLQVISVSMDQLNEEGQDKVVDYAADLVASGRYIKDDQLGVVQENA